MALAIDAISSTSGALSAGPFNWSHTVSGASTGLIVWVSHFDSSDTVAGVTYNGVSMTPIPSGSTSNGQCYIDGFYLIAPASGTNTVSVSVSGSVFDFGAMAVSFTGAHQTTMLGTAATATGTSTTPSVNASSAAGEIVSDGLAIVHSGTLSVGAGQTSQWNAIATGGFIKYAGSTETGSGTTTMSWSNSTSQVWALAAVPVKPAGASSFQSAWAKGSNVLIGMN